MGSTVRKFRTVQQERKREVARDRMHYNLDAVASVGYRLTPNAVFYLDNGLIKFYSIN
ncbi:RhuM family protein [Salegentibacter mishustinae]|uniref:RhuM family protein n=1 Tax=Salegentibacter mishustinae TaxID=270918 RepID=UPI002491997E|nr:RhuM family protein [Salegentibacter mishustinae]